MTNGLSPASLLARSAAFARALAQRSIRPPLTRVCKGFLRWDMASNLQVGLGFWPGFRQQPDAAPEPTLEEQPSEPVDAMSGYADGAARPAPGVAM